MRDVVTVMISCEQRVLSREVTIPQLQAQGFEPEVFLSPCRPAGPEGNRRVSREALWWASLRDADVLFVEDDIDIDSTFAWHVNAARTLDAVTYLYLNDSTARLYANLDYDTATSIATRLPIPRGPYPLRDRVGLFGTQAVLIPKRLVDTLLCVLDAATPREPFDGALFMYLRRKRAREAVYVALPHPVQHRGVRVGREATRRVMLSMSYGTRSSGVLEGFEGIAG